MYSGGLENSWISPRRVVFGVPVGMAPAGRQACRVPQSFGLKFANENLDYIADFSYLAGERCGDSVMTFSVVALPGGLAALNVSQKMMCGMAAKFFLGGGVPGMQYIVAVVATTALGRTMQGAASLTIAYDRAPVNPARSSPPAEDIVGSNGRPITDGSGNPITTA